MASAQLTCVIGLLLLAVTSAGNPSATYRAATVQYEPYFKEFIIPTDLMLVNVNRYAEYATKAAQEKAIIVVFPEDGIMTLESDDNFTFTRESIFPQCQTVPNPKEVSWNPCLNPLAYNQTEALHVISCAARNNSIAILANTLSKEKCNKENDPECPSEGQYIYNTNVVFDKTGTLIARYHKHHLYTEEGVVNSPKHAEYVIFNIEGIDFATFICFDLMYKDPPVDLVRQYGIKNFIFSTAWLNQMPFLLGPQLYSRWARGLGVNLIVTNYYKPQYTRLSTGIYSSQLGALNETFDISTAGILLTADLPINPCPVPEESLCLLPIQSQSNESTNDKTNNTYKQHVLTDKPSSRPVDPIHRIYYQPLINFTTVYLKKSDGNITVCQRGACCNLIYSLSSNNDLGVYALLAFDGIHPFNKYRMGMQTCSVMRCENERDIESCGRVPETTPLGKFNKFSLLAQLESDIVFPSVIKGDLQLLSAKDWSFAVRNCEGNKSLSKIELDETDRSILIASLYARFYDRDYIVSDYDDDDYDY